MTTWIVCCRALASVPPDELKSAARQMSTMSPAAIRRLLHLAGNPAVASAASPLGPTLSSSAENHVAAPVDDETLRARVFLDRYPCDEHIAA